VSLRTGHTESQKSSEMTSCNHNIVVNLWPRGLATARISGSPCQDLTSWYLSCSLL